MIRFLTAGESHGQGLVVVLEGVPAGLAISEAEIQGELGRRRLGFGRGPRMRFEKDELTLLGGIRHGRTLGSPIAIEIHNSEWPKWQEEMSPSLGATTKPLSTPRPGHADLTGMLKYGFDDARDVLERASARETAARVVAGAIAKKMLAEIGVSILSHVISLGQVSLLVEELPQPKDLAEIDASEIRCFDRSKEELMIAEIKAAAKVGDSLGGAAQVVAWGVPVGLGSHVHWDRRIDGLLAHALMSIQAIKAVEIGDGIEVSSKLGSQAHDAVFWDSQENSYYRTTDRAGGVEGGMTTGAPLIMTAYMKPLATLNRPVLETVDVATKQATVSFKERTDVTAVPAMGVVAETMVALVLLDEAVRKFGGDSVSEFVRNYSSYVQALGNTDSKSQGTHL
ncbi:chorismate synthase [Acidithrix sp. C25]